MLPDNALFLPIQVGAANAAAALPMARDDTGDNISEKNPTYCELTAQYWGWKNLDADYLGLCHYRRFLCFSQTEDRRNERNQIVASTLGPFQMEKYGLEDPAQMRSVIEEADVVTGEPQIVGKLYTPRGARHTAYGHWTAHDRDLIRKQDLDRMLKILEEVSPEVGVWAKRYLQGRTFGGFNCFVMKRELYHALCELEFETLSRLEAQVDRTCYSAQMNRVFGFMGEIISSAYIDYLENSRGLRVRHVPLLYFENTDPGFLPVPLGNQGGICVLFCVADVLDVLFSAQLRSFLEHMEEEQTYDIWVVSRARREVQKLLSHMAQNYGNVSLRWMDADLLVRDLEEQYGQGTVWLPLMPYVMEKYDRMLVFGSNLLFTDSVSALWYTGLPKGKVLAAPRDLLMVARYNDIFPQTEAQYLDGQLKNPFDYVTDRVMVWDFAAYRRTYSPAWICARLKNSFGALRNSAEAMNVICQGKIRILPCKWGIWSDGNEEIARQLNYLPLQFARQWRDAQGEGGIVCYSAEEPFFPRGTAADLLFWRYARQTPLYESCLAHMNYVIAAPRREPAMDRLKRRLKKSGALGRFFARTFPRGSYGYRAAEWVMRRFDG